MSLGTVLLAHLALTAALTTALLLVVAVQGAARRLRTPAVPVVDLRENDARVPVPSS